MERVRGDLSELDREALVKVVGERIGDTPKGRLATRLLEGLTPANPGRDTADRRQLRVPKARSAGFVRAGRGGPCMLQEVVPEAKLVQTERGLVPTGDGWFVLNARETQWWDRPGRGVLCEFEGAEVEGATDFTQLGINLTLLRPGEPMSVYHWEADQEDFLVLLGEALLIVEGEERALRQWDFVHCPPGTNHTIVGAGSRPCVVLAAGARDRSTGSEWGAYTVEETALRHGAGVERETSDARVAYAPFGSGTLTGYREGWLPADYSDGVKTGTFLGVPYDWRRPTVARVKSRWWNPNDPRLFTPRAFGWGWDVNFARVFGRR